MQVISCAGRCLSFFIGLFFIRSQKTAQKLKGEKKVLKSGDRPHAKAIGLIDEVQGAVRAKVVPRDVGGVPVSRPIPFVFDWLASNQFKSFIDLLASLS